ncbi:conserved hypothetical protein [Vibrio nigripulchritudo MADA3029]|uniref:hypothetical protein n=1 Tax=Vibrio nigripulchritudo TaxID=28173 RepID=UPI0003B202C8|nr:hypothetical protein [Vibrio nigripulchritudo]CCN46686.1 conserved hypothetical protein [Vibrio nigripulchritudo MADA3020]CCN54537.1 conserved hypothetical protein [Vibrio nigripulchritudo MADA3021]CCN59545.1 conserved hypothetical protein [Vibrio nigripulchritudo MADA3029]
MSKIILYFVLILGVAALVVIDEKDETQDHQKAKQSVESSDGTAPSSPPKETSNNLSDGTAVVIHSGVSAVESAEPSYDSKPTQVSDPWFEVTDTLTIDSLKPLSEAIETLLAIEFKDIDELAELASGDKVNLTLPNGEGILISVTHAKQQPNHIKTWSGIFETQGSQFPVVFTFGESNVFGFIGHPDAEYKITGIKNTAWLYEVPTEHYFEAPH